MTSNMKIDTSYTSRLHRGFVGQQLLCISNPYKKYIIILFEYYIFNYILFVGTLSKFMNATDFNWQFN